MEYQTIKIARDYKYRIEDSFLANVGTDDEKRKILLGLLPVYRMNSRYVLLEELISSHPELTPKQIKYSQVDPIIVADGCLNGGQSSTLRKKRAAMTSEELFVQLSELLKLHPTITLDQIEYLHVLKIITVCEVDDYIGYLIAPHCLGDSMQDINPDKYYVNIKEVPTILDCKPIKRQKSIFWRHKKSGEIYSILHSEAYDCTNERDDRIMIIYCQKTNSDQWYVREESEFYEKFEELPSETVLKGK